MAFVLLLWLLQPQQNISIQNMVTKFSIVRKNFKYDDVLFYKSYNYQSNNIKVMDLFQLNNEL